jgi:hypothetical protein
MEERLISRLLKLNKWEEVLVASAKVAHQAWVALASKSLTLRKFEFVINLYVVAQLPFPLMEQAVVEVKTILHHHPIMREVEMIVTEAKAIIKVTVVAAITIMVVQVAEVVEGTTDMVVTLTTETIAEVEVATSW